ncbi:beta-ketoacyl-ACP synthase III [Actinomadura formosensis]|uniref:beta-ketoacyl-ACP synthase III n=1 Tax=Actinomadura formosensis TaxID=60706 RepID=UPI001F5E79EB|nr:beta-ketoacyl-ACP synthase III [Actinomadura formosensis]
MASAGAIEQDSRDPGTFQPGKRSRERAAVLCGVGAYIPPSVVTNADLTVRFDTSDEWIRTRTGIVKRHVVDRGTATSDLAERAGAAALKAAGVRTVDAVVLATTTPDHPCPGTAPMVAERLGMSGTPAYDVNAVCSGFVYGMATAAGLIAAGVADDLLLIGADSFTTLLNPHDRDTVTIFGDGAGAVVLRSGGPDEPGAVHAFDLGSDGALADLIMVPAGGSRRPPRAMAHGADDARSSAYDDAWFSMQGRAVYRHAVRRMTGSSRTALRRAGWTADDVDLFVGHQANVRILQAVAGELGIPDDRVCVNVDQVGNTAAASIPLALAHAVSSGQLREGDKVLLTAFGGGATWGSCALTWPKTDPPSEGPTSF